MALDPHYRAPLRDPNDLIVLQTAERGEADILCTDDGDFYDPVILSYCAARGIEVGDELTPLERLVRFNQPGVMPSLRTKPPQASHLLQFRTPVVIQMGHPRGVLSSGS